MKCCFSVYRDCMSFLLALETNYVRRLIVVLMKTFEAKQHSSGDI